MKKSNNKNLKIIFISIGITLCILISVLVVVYSLERKNSSNNVSTVIQQDVSSIINNLGSKFIVQKQSEESGFTYDIYLEFKEAIYVDEKSNERLYTNLMSQVISNLKTSVRFIDESQDLIIRATYDAEENKYYYTVNGEEDYFKKQNSLNSLNNYSKSQNTDFRVQSEIINSLVNSGWKSNQDIFGTKESIYNDYDIFFDEGIEVKSVSNKIYNVIFNEKYKENIVNGIKVGDSQDKIKSAMGEPTFSQDGIIGYKNEDIYIFFYNKEISIYRNEQYDYSEFINILQKYLNNEINVKEFTNQLTYLWGDYSSYTYDSSFVNLVYSNQGVEINLTSDNPNGITIYGNYGNIKEIVELVENNNISAKLDYDLIFLDEINRINRNNQQLIPDLSKPEYIGESKNFIEHLENNKVEFYSKNSNYPSCRLVEPIESYFWFDDNIFVFSIKGKGIFYYNVVENKKEELISGTEDYVFNSYENGILNYDDNIELEIGSD